MAKLRSGVLRGAIGTTSCFELPVAYRHGFHGPLALFHTSVGKFEASRRDDVGSYKKRIPPQSWDSHMHVVEPHRYPVSRDAVYMPSSHTLEEALAFESTVGIENVVFVQPSIYGTDNSCLLAALQRVGPSRGRGVVVIDPGNTPQSTLVSWHKLGVRGLRINLQSVGKVLTESELAETLIQHANVIRSLGWMIQLYLPLRMVPMLEAIVPKLGVKICIDHYGSPDLSSMAFSGDSSISPYTLPGFSSLVSLLNAGQTYVKLSAPYRFSVDKRLRDIEAITTELLQKAPNRLVFATDWPHTRFPDADISPFAELCLRLCARKPGLADRVFRLNAEELMKSKEELP